MVAYLAAGECPHLPTNRGWRQLEGSPPIAFCNECDSFVEISIAHALKFNHTYVLDSIFDYKFCTKYRAEHPMEKELQVYSAYRHWKQRHWDEVLARVGYVSENKELTPTP